MAEAGEDDTSLVKEWDLSDENWGHIEYHTFICAFIGASGFL
jgi:hypothetical protein